MENDYVTKKELKEELDKQSEKLQNYMGTLYEKFQSDVKFLAEQVGTITQQQKETDRIVNLTFNEVGNINVKISTVMDMLETKVDVSDHQALEHRVTSLETRL